MGKILVVDDDSRIREILKEILKGAGHEIELAASAPEAFRKITLNDYDLITMDIRMPEMNGIEGIHSIKMIRESQKIIVLTGSLSESTWEEIRTAGADLLLLKPKGISEIKGAVAEMLAS